MPGRSKGLISVELKLNLGILVLKAWNGKSWRDKPKAIALKLVSNALYLSPEDCVAYPWKRSRGFDPGTVSLICFYSDLTFTENSAKSIPLPGAFPDCHARWCKPRFSAKHSEYFLLAAWSQPRYVGDGMLSVLEGVMQRTRHAEIRLVGQRQLHVLILLCFTVLMCRLNKYVSFSTCRDAKPDTLRTLKSSQIP